MINAKHVVNFADERLVPKSVPWHQHQLIKDHLSRYRFAANIIKKGAIVVDAACGTGYGSVTLAKKASMVTAIDIDPNTITYAQNHYPHPRVVYRTADVCRTPLTKASVDTVVSFETLEHLKRQNNFLTEIKRVLKPHGSFIVSTPNILVNGGEANPFHLKELSFIEFTTLLNYYFPNIKMYGQKPMPAAYLHTVIPIISALPPNRFRWLLDSATKMMFRGSAVKPINQFSHGWVPAFFIAVCKT